MQLHSTDPTSTADSLSVISHILLFFPEQHATYFMLNLSSSSVFTVCPGC